MRRITVAGAGLALLAGVVLTGVTLTGVVAADAQGIGYAPGVNPSNPQDLRFRSNPQDLLAPGGYNRQDLVRRPPSVAPLTRPNAASVPTTRSQSSGLRTTVKSKPKQKKPRARASAARR
jgi:hypothetical protein